MWKEIVVVAVNNISNALTAVVADDEKLLAALPIVRTGPARVVYRGSQRQERRTDETRTYYRRWLQSGPYGW
jgi:hypothetical protein